MTKSEFRKIYLNRQRNLSDGERNEKSRKIADGFFENFNLETVTFLHLFLSLEINREIATSFIYNRIWQNFPEITVVIPRVNFQTMRLENVEFNSVTELCKNKWHIPEPKATGGFIETGKIDAVLVPLLCFDRKGFRVGYGKGFYDKFLSECRTDCLKIGLSYFAPVDEISDAQNFDVKLDFVLTPKEIFASLSSTDL